ncbi:uncharacterized protein LOC117293636 [Asterias rubens]|uniref:uncharacterized protein LOC117293636 n=1 Tax=Asterias rubens TaxID=7604 RepID=UPI001455742E|nr:uncharacterized protein LOC117293636 [Asterias rubens]
MSIAGSLAGESVYYEEPYSVPGPCRTCCIRCPCPSLLSVFAFLGGAVLFCIAAVIAGQHTSELFQPTPIASSMNDWIGFIRTACYVECPIMALIAIALFGISCLGTGAVRKEFMSRFTTRAKGRCQTGLFMIIVYVLFLIWLAVSFVSLVPVMFFYIQRRGVCEARLYPPVVDQDPLCIELKQWALVDGTLETDFSDKICGTELDKWCTSPVLLWYSLAFFAAVLVTLSMLHFLINYAANFAKLRDRFKDGYVNRKSGAYLVRTGSVRASGRHSMRARSSLRGSRNNVLRGSQGSLKSVSVRGGNNHVGANSTASTLRMTAYNNEALSGDEIYAMNNLNLNYDREPVGALQTHYAERPLHPPPDVMVPPSMGSRHGTDEPAMSVAGTDIGPPPSYGAGHPNGWAPSYSSSISGGQANGNYPVNSRPMNYGGEDHYPGNSKPSNSLYYDRDAGDGSGSVHGSNQQGSGENSDGVFGGGRWGKNYSGGYERNGRPLTSFSEPEPAPSMTSAGSHPAPRGYSEHFI